MPLVKVLRNGQVTLPKDFRDKLGVAEGDLMEVELAQGSIVFKPKVVLDKAEVELSEQGRKKILAALEAYKSGKAKEFGDVEALIKELNS